MESTSGYNYNNYFETTSSNCIISSQEHYTYAIPIVFYRIGTSYYNTGTGQEYSYNVYHQDGNGDYYDIFTFFTNEQSKRQLTLTSSGAYDWWMTYIHEDDINK